MGAWDAPSIMWQKEYGPLKGDCVLQTADGGFLIGGEAADLNGYGWENNTAYLIKTDALGNLLWNNTYCEGTVDLLLQTQDGGYAFEVNHLLNPGYEYTLIKVNETGGHQWNMTFQIDDNSPKNRLTTSEDNIVYQSIYKKSTEKSITNQTCIINQTGTLLNQDKITHYPNLTDNQFLTAILTDTGLAVFGMSPSSTFTFTDYDGNVIYYKELPVNGIRAIRVSDEGYVLLKSESTTKTFILKIDKTGNSLWNSTYEAEKIGNSNIFETKDGYILHGDSNAGEFLAKYSLTGTFMWQQIFTPIRNTQLTNRGIIQTTDDGYALAFTQNYPFSNTTVALIKTGPEVEVIQTPTPTENPTQTPSPTPSQQATPTPTPEATPKADTNLQNSAILLSVPLAGLVIAVFCYKTLKTKKP